MPYIYHAVPRDMQGAVLYPLNKQREFDETLYEAHAKKYEGREHVMQQRIPLLSNCLWNDVLFFTAVHPAEFRVAFESGGHPRPRPFRAFCFDIADLDHTCMAVVTKMQTNEPKEYERFDQKHFDEYATIPQATIDYWREARAAGKERMFLYLHIPHILYLGSLDTAVASIVEA